jgi:hypothetical protein
MFQQQPRPEVASDHQRTEGGSQGPHRYQGYTRKPRKHAIFAKLYSPEITADARFKRHAARIRPMDVIAIPPTARLLQQGMNHGGIHHNIDTQRYRKAALLLNGNTG